MALVTRGETSSRISLWVTRPWRHGDERWPMEVTSNTYFRGVSTNNTISSQSAIWSFIQRNPDDRQRKPRRGNNRSSSDCAQIDADWFDAAPNNWRVSLKEINLSTPDIHTKKRLRYTQSIQILPSPSTTTPYRPFRTPHPEQSKPGPNAEMTRSRAESCPNWAENEAWLGVTKSVTWASRSEGRWPNWACPAWSGIRLHPFGTSATSLSRVWMAVVPLPVCRHRRPSLAREVLLWAVFVPAGAGPSRAPLPCRSLCEPPADASVGFVSLQEPKWRAHLFVNMSLHKVPHTNERRACSVMNLHKLHWVRTKTRRLLNLPRVQSTLLYNSVPRHSSISGDQTYYPYTC